MEIKSNYILCDIKNGHFEVCDIFQFILVLTRKIFDLKKIFDIFLQSPLRYRYPWFICFTTTSLFFFLRRRRFYVMEYILLFSLIFNTTNLWIPSWSEHSKDCWSTLPRLLLPLCSMKIVFHACIFCFGFDLLIFARMCCFNEKLIFSYVSQIFSHEFLHPASPKSYTNNLNWLFTSLEVNHKQNYFYI